LTDSEESSFSEEKEAKRLCVVRRALANQRTPKRAKVFCFFFSKKEEFGGHLAVRPGLMSHPTGQHCLRRRNSDSGHSGGMGFGWFGFAGPIPL
jgi:hypothetical protein